MEKGLTIPLDLEDISDLSLGDIVFFDGLIFTAGPQFHLRALKQGIVPSIDFSRANVMLHTTPNIRRAASGWEVVAIEPMPSLPLEPFGEGIIKALGLRAIIGKTTMGEGTMRAAKDYGCLHVSKLGIYGRTLAWRVKRVVDVCFLDELGPAEATWLLEVQDFGPFVVDIDRRGNNLFHQLKEEMDERRRETFRVLGLDETYTSASI